MGGDDVEDGRAPAGWGRPFRRLVDQGIVSAEAALDGDVHVELLTRSNRLALVHVGGSMTVALKRHQLVPIGHDTASVERSAYRAFAGADVAPRLLDVDGDVLAIDAAGGGTLNDALARTSDATEETSLLALLGRTLAALHGSAADGLERRRPWVFGIVDGALPANLHGDESLAALVAEVAEQPELRRALLAVARAWRDEVPIHGDVKFDNVLVRRRGDESVAVLIDWEFAGLGLAVWDLAGILDGLVVPAFQAGGLGGVRAQLRRSRAAFEAYGPAFDAQLLADATLARLAQSVIQFAAMREHDPAHRDLADALLAAADDLAGAVREQHWAPAPA